MNTAIDPITIGFVGGAKVGKTTLLKRFCGQTDNQFTTPTDGVNMVALKWKLRNNLDIKIRLIDFSSEVVNGNISNRYVEYLIHNLNVVFYVIDITKQKSVEDLEKWYAFIHSIDDSISMEYMLVHKAETLHMQTSVFPMHSLEKISNYFHLQDWWYTVGFEGLGDIDYRRKEVFPVMKQKAPCDILHQLCLMILLQRQPRSFTIIPTTPMCFEYCSWVDYTMDELDAKDIP